MLVQSSLWCARNRHQLKLREEMVLCVVLSDLVLAFNRSKVSICFQIYCELSLISWLFLGLPAKSSPAWLHSAKVDPCSCSVSQPPKAQSSFIFLIFNDLQRNCTLELVKVSTYVNGTMQGKSIYYSYETCGPSNCNKFLRQGFVSKSNFVFLMLSSIR